MLFPPEVRLKRALVPSAVLLPGWPPSGAGVTAWDVVESAKQVSASEIRNKARRKGARFISIFMIVIVDPSKFMFVPFVD